MTDRPLIFEEIKARVDALRAEASRESTMSWREIFRLTDPIVDLLERTPTDDSEAIVKRLKMENRQILKAHHEARQTIDRLREHSTYAQGIDAAAMCAINNQDCSPWEIAEAIRALSTTAQADPEQYVIGQLTMKRVFQASGLTNLSDLQAVLDQVEVALAAYDSLTTPSA